MQLECYARTETGLVRPSNQDAVGCFPELGLFAVADGMGGHDAGDVASRMAVDELRAFYERTGRADGKRLAEAVAHANQQIFDAGRVDGKVSSRPMGTTVVAVTLSKSPRRVTWAYVGDSRLYRWRKGELQLLTADHTRFGGRFAGSEEIPLELPHTNELLAALGIEPEIAPGLGAAPWRNGDVYLLCSDGISGLVSPAQLITDLGQPDPLDTVGARVVEHALEAGGSDNASVVLVRAST